MSCKNREYVLGKGDMVLFEPGDSHACSQQGGGSFDYRGFHIPGKTMQKAVKEAAGQEIPAFSCNVIQDEELACYFRELHGKVMDGGRLSRLQKEELWTLLMTLLVERYGCPLGEEMPACREEVERACVFLREHLGERISLEQICRHAGLGSSTLLRAFTREKGVTPYRYLETVRVDEAKRLLEQGKTPLEAALLTGFSDQSHFTNFFRSFIGLTPGAYRNIFLQGDKRTDGE